MPPRRTRYGSPTSCALWRTVGATPVVVALAPDVEAPAGARVVRARARGSAIAAIRLGMAQLTNTVAPAVLLVPLGAERASLVALLALVDAAKRDEQAVVAFANASLDESALTRCRATPGSSSSRWRKAE
jgi:hypothetical protein